jgi:hypothetical protein
MQREHFFARLWEDFVKIAPRAAALRHMLLEAGEHVENDHVAFRTLARPGLGISALEARILDLGYAPLDDYEFPDKHLRARAYLCDGSPRIFLSELVVEELSDRAQALLDGLAQQAVRVLPAGPEIFWAGRLWQPLPFADYESLAEESEYAGWLAALGLRPNHFTVSINALKRLCSVEAVLGFAEAAGYRINKVGGRVKGTPMDLLEQGSTLAELVPVEFEGGEVHEIPTCYYEFALRYRGAGGELYQGFVPSSAGRIFESTNRR